jgi:hypothetical protein
LSEHDLGDTVAQCRLVLPSTQIVQLGHDADALDRTWADRPDDGVMPVARFLADNDIVVNCVRQDPATPLIFVTEKALPPSRQEPLSSMSPAT